MTADGLTVDNFGFAFLASIAVRTAIILFVVVTGIRFFGRRAIGGGNVYDLVLVLAIANAVQNAMTKGSGHLAVGIVSAGTLIILGWLIGRRVATDPSFEARLVGTPVVLVRDGELVLPNLRIEGITREQVMAAVRAYGISRLDQVKLAVLELDGSLSVIQADEPE